MSSGAGGNVEYDEIPREIRSSLPGHREFNSAIREGNYVTLRRQDNNNASAGGGRRGGGRGRGDGSRTRQGGIVFNRTPRPPQPRHD